MKLLYSYLRRYWPLILLALLLATINQVFSLLDPLIFRYVIDRYATRFAETPPASFSAGSACCWLLRWAWRLPRGRRRTFRITTSA